MAKSLIGIDISTIEAVMAHGGRIYYDQMPANLVNSSEILSPESLADYLKELKKASRINGNDCAIVLPQTTTFFRTVNSPIMSDEQIKLNLPYEFRNYVGQDGIKYNFDYFVDHIDSDENGKPQSMTLVAAAGLKELTEEFAHVAKRAGLKLQLALPHEVCLINLMKKGAEPKKEYCLIGLGYDYTNIYMFKGSEITGTKRVELGCHDIDAVIALQSNIDEFLASKYRDTNHKNCLEMEELNETYERIALEVMKTINFYRYEHNESELDTAYFFSLGATNEKLTASICEHVNFKMGDISDILPSNYKQNEDAARCLVSIAATL